MGGRARGLLCLGACSWTAKGWAGAFYLKSKRQSDYIAEYSERFSTVEIDSSFYGLPRQSTVERWRDLTPEGFLFSAKAPQTITHEKFLENCEGELERFVETMALLGGKLGPLLFQFPYFAKRRGVTFQEYLDRLAPFLELLPKERFQFAVEVRNKHWIAPPLLDLLRGHGVALALIDHPWMHRPGELFSKHDVVTGPFVYIRWLGDRNGIEKLTKVWNEVVIDRGADLDAWVPPIKAILDRQVRVYGYVNNHYSGYAPHDIEVLERHLAHTGKQSP